MIGYVSQFAAARRAATEGTPSDPARPLPMGDGSALGKEGPRPRRQVLLLVDADSFEAFLDCSEHGNQAACRECAEMLAHSRIFSGRRSR